MRLLALIIVITACGSEETVTTTTTTVPTPSATPAESPTNTPDTPTPPATPKSASTTKPSTAPTSTTQTPDKDYFIKFVFNKGDQTVGAVNCTVYSTSVFEYSKFFYVDKETFELQTTQTGCETAGIKAVTCTITDNYIEKIAECGVADPNTGKRAIKKPYKVYSEPDFSGWEDKT